jgi:hypothetical protein
VETPASTVAGTGSRSISTATGSAASSAPAVTATVSTAERVAGDGPNRARCTATAICRPVLATPAIAVIASRVASALRSAAVSCRAPSTGTTYASRFASTPAAVTASPAAPMPSRLVMPSSRLVMLPSRPVVA